MSAYVPEEPAPEMEEPLLDEKAEMMMGEAMMEPEMMMEP